MPVYNKTCVNPRTEGGMMIKPAINTLGRKIRERGKSTQSFSQVRARDFAVSNSLASASCDRTMHWNYYRRRPRALCALCGINTKKEAFVEYVCNRVSVQILFKKYLDLLLFKKFQIKIIF